MGLKSIALLAAVLLLTLPGVAEAAFPGENGKIVFEHNSPGFGCDAELFTVNPDGSGTTSISSDPTRGGHLPVWSPDGKRLALAGQSTGCTTSTIWVENADGSSRHQITTDTVYNNTPGWSPDGHEIVFETNRDPIESQPGCGNRRDLYIAGDDGTSPRPLTADDNIDAQPDWSPSGDRIVYSKRLVGFDDLCTPIFFGGGTYLINPDGTDERQIEIFGQDYDWSPDRTRIVYRDGPGDLWVSQVGSFSACCDVKLTNTSDVEAEPTWSPDGKLIAYVRGPALWVMNADGSNQHQITSGSSADRNPDWQPIIRGYARPKGATPMYLPLVPAAQACTAPNTNHGAPLSYGSCSPPSSTSPNITVSFGEFYAKSIGSVRLRVLPGTAGPPDDADVDFNMSVTNVMKSDRSDYTGELRLELPLRITDNSNFPSPDGGRGGTVSDASLFATVPCTATSDTTLGALCALNSTIDSIVPGAVQEGSRANWELGQVKLHDGGADGDADTTGDNRLFEVQGVFVP